MNSYQNHYRSAYGPAAKKMRPNPRLPQMIPSSSHPDDDKRLQSFKEWMLNQKNDINEQDALAAYIEYKLDFVRKQCDRFFKEHKDEEWFRNKYHPESLKKFAESNKEAKEKRKAAYEKLVTRHNMNDIALDYEQQDKISKILHEYSLLLEGATIEEIEDGSADNLYTVSSLFIHYLPPSVDKSMLEEYAKSHPGFLRIAMSEAQNDRGFRRRAWVSYKQMSQESLKKLSWEFNKQRFDVNDIRASINKEMSNRIRYGPYWFNHNDSAKSDLKNVAKLLIHYEGDQCPLLDSIKEHLIEETNEEEKVLGLNEQSTVEFNFERDSKLFQALDKAILYLRLVYSYDYYAASEYLGEDDMPQKIGIIFCRPMIPSSIDENPDLVLREFIEAQRMRVKNFLEKPTISESEQKRIGKKNADEEVENFVFKHTHQKKAGHFKCTITGKVFEGPEFVRKHMFNKCADKIDAVRTDTEFFNNYLADPERPM